MRPELNPSVGDRVTFIDSDDTPRRAVVVDGVADAEYVTLVTSDQGELGEDYTHSVTTHTSIYPHADLGDQFTATAGNAFKPGWPDDDADREGGA